MRVNKPEKYPKISQLGSDSEFLTRLCLLQRSNIDLWLSPSCSVSPWRRFAILDCLVVVK